MAAGDTQITIVGNLVEDPNLRFTPSGQAVATFRIASTPRFLDRQTNEWKDGEGQQDPAPGWRWRRWFRWQRWRGQLLRRRPGWRRLRRWGLQCPERSGR